MLTTDDLKRRIALAKAAITALDNRGLRTTEQRKAIEEHHRAYDPYSAITICEELLAAREEIAELREVLRRIAGGDAMTNEREWAREALKVCRHD